MTQKPTWKSHPLHGELDSDRRDALPASTFAFPKQCKAPRTDWSHVRNALARFNRVEDASDADRDRAFANIKAAAERFGVDVAEARWQQLGKRPHTWNTRTNLVGAVADVRWATHTANFALGDHTAAGVEGSPTMQDQRERARPPER